jgi:hypothetical protein
MELIAEIKSTNYWLRQIAIWLFVGVVFIPAVVGIFKGLFL